MLKHIAAYSVLLAAATPSVAIAGGLGFVASVRSNGAYTFIDVFVGVSNWSDKFEGCVNANITSQGGFYQAAGLSNKTWKPDAANFISARSSIDSFMTAGTLFGGAYGGEFYASTNTNGDPNFTGTSWNPTPASPAANSVPANAGWYTGDPTSIDNTPESLAGLAYRINLSLIHI